LVKNTDAGISSVQLIGGASKLHNEPVDWLKTQMQELAQFN